MKSSVKRKMALIPAILCIALSIIIFVFADGLRRFYSGAFFLILGITLFVTTRSVLKK